MDRNINYVFPIGQEKPRFLPKGIHRSSMYKALELELEGGVHALKEKPEEVKKLTGQVHDDLHSLVDRTYQEAYMAAAGAEQDSPAIGERDAHGRIGKETWQQYRTALAPLLEKSAPQTRKMILAMAYTLGLGAGIQAEKDYAARTGTDQTVYHTDQDGQRNSEELTAFDLDTFYEALRIHLKEDIILPLKEKDATYGMRKALQKGKHLWRQISGQEKAAEHEDIVAHLRRHLELPLDRFYGENWENGLVQNRESVPLQYFRLDEEKWQELQKNIIHVIGQMPAKKQDYASLLVRTIIYSVANQGLIDGNKKLRSRRLPRPRYAFKDAQG
ncbi:MAG: hypothetical protein GXP63_05280 [DPANN group archaeon]|nr:hypothetical protein [DPANN group archaeon]